VARLGIANAEAVAGRAEDVPPLDCDVILSRLTGRMEDVLVSCARHRRPAGTVVFYKNLKGEPDIRRTTRVLAKLRLRISGFHDIALPDTNIIRRLVVVTSA
jgi:16S rRNA G527 N7-methylase RsmG